MGQSALDRGHPGTWRANGGRHLARDGMRRRKAIPERVTRVLNRATWSSRELSRVLVVLLVKLFVPTDAPMVMGLDETIERRPGRKIAARGVYRDPVRSSKEFFVKTHGLRWISMMLLTRVPWACRVWALPFLTVLAPSERYHEERGMGHKTITDWAWQMILQVSRWLPGRYLVVVADGTYAVLEFLLKVSHLPHVCAITRLRLDACLYDPAPARPAGKRGRNALKGKAQPKLSGRLSDPSTQWQKHTLSWYGGTTREMEIATGTALWYQSPVPPVAIRCVTIWGERRNANGRIWRSCARLLPCWACFRSSPFLPSNCWRGKRFPFARRPGTAKPCRPFPIRLLICVSISGPPLVFRCRPQMPTPCKFHEPFSTALWIRLLLLLSHNVWSVKLG